MKYWLQGGWGITEHNHVVSKLQIPDIAWRARLASRHINPGPLDATIKQPKNGHLRLTPE